MRDSEPPLRPCAAALLAGGNSSRMGRDKALLDWGGAPLWRVQLGKLIELNPDRLLLSCREEQRLKNVFAEFVFDAPGHPGPLGAIVRCLEALVSGGPPDPPALLVLAVDMPAMTTDFLRSLLDARGGAAAGVVCRGPERFEPLCAVYPAGALEPLRALRDAGSARMQAAAQHLAEAGLVRVRQLRDEELPLFFNANTPEEYAWMKPAPSASN